MAALLLVLTMAGASFAQSAPRAYAVVSEVARQVRVVTFQAQTGTRLNANLVQIVNVPNNELDKIFLLGSQKLLKQASPAADIWLLATADSDFFAPSGFEDGAPVKMPDDLAAALRERKSTHLLVFTRHKSEAYMRFREAVEGVGTLEGLGWYVDTSLSVRDLDTGDTGAGFMASYTHFRATLIDVAASRVVKTLTTRANRINIAGVNAKGNHPWSALSATEKMTQLRDLVLAELDRLVPELINAKP